MALDSPRRCRPRAVGVARAPRFAQSFFPEGCDVLESDTRAPQIAPGRAGHLAAVVALGQAESSFAANRDQWLDVLATQLIFVGDHGKALEYNSKAYAQRRGGAESDGSELEGFEPRPAMAAILELARD